MEISKKQRQLLELIEDPSITELLIGGSGGGSKTLSMGLAITVLARKYPGARFFVGRKTLKSLKQSTINTLITKVFPLRGVKLDEYAFHAQDMTLDFTNGSKIIFGELDYMPSDPDYERFGSTEYDAGFIDEAGEITLAAKSAIKSRVGRGVMAKNYDIPGFLVLSCNPSRNFLRQEYYDPYFKLGAGDFQKWSIGDVTIHEGTPEERKIPAYRAFLRMGAYDNPFLPQSYIDNLKTLPDKERKRILEGRWDFVDEDDMLFKTGLLDKATTYDLPEAGGQSFVGVDVSDRGKDATVFTLIKNGVVITQKVSSVQLNWDNKSDKPLGRLLADELIEFCQRNGLTSQDAENIAVECNGVGTSLRDMMKTRGWYIYEYTATHKTRSEGYYQLMLDFDSGKLKLKNDLLGLDELKKELAAHTYEMHEQTPDVCKKEKIKQSLGRSPDLADSLMIADFVMHTRTDRAGDRYNSARVVF